MIRKSTSEIEKVVDEILLYLKNNNDKTCLEICDYVSKKTNVNNSNIAYYLKNMIFSEKDTLEFNKLIENEITSKLTIYKKKMYKKMIIKKQDFYTIKYKLVNIE